MPLARAIAISIQATNDFFLLGAFDFRPINRPIYGFFRIDACTAFILASTTVERQWTQRRGRLLRL